MHPARQCPHEIPGCNRYGFSILREVAVLVTYPALDKAVYNAGTSLDVNRADIILGQPYSLWLPLMEWGTRVRLAHIVQREALAVVSVRESRNRRI